MAIPRNVVKKKKQKNLICGSFGNSMDIISEQITVTIMRMPDVVSHTAIKTTNN